MVKLKDLVGRGIANIALLLPLLLLISSGKNKMHAHYLSLPQKAVIKRHILAFFIISAVLDRLVNAHYTLLSFLRP